MATTEFLAHGYTGTSLERIAELAGFSKGAVYGNFAGKEQLALAVLENHFFALLQKFVGEFAAGGDTIEDRLAVLERWWRRCWPTTTGRCFAVEFAVHTRRNPKIQEQLAQRERMVRAAVTTLLSQQIQQLGVKPVLPPEQLGIVLVSVVGGIAVQRLIDPTIPASLMTRCRQGALPSAQSRGGMTMISRRSLAFLGFALVVVAATVQSVGADPSAPGGSDAQGRRPGDRRVTDRWPVLGQPLLPRRGSATSKRSTSSPAPPPTGDWLTTATSTPRPTRCASSSAARPIPARFNGTAVLEWFNVSLQQEVEHEWPIDFPMLMRDGYVSASVSAQYLGVQSASPMSLKNWDPQRYGSLQHPGDDYSYDIFAQAAQALRSGLAARYRPADLVLGTGTSQSCLRLVTYVSKLAAGDGVFDGYHPTTCPATAEVPDNLVPMVWGTSEWEAGIPSRPDGPLLRVWEIAGTSHANWWEVRFQGAQGYRDGFAYDGTTYFPYYGWDEDDAGQYGERRPFSNNVAPARYAFRAAIDNLNRWAHDWRDHRAGRLAADQVRAAPAAARLERDGYALAPRRARQRARWPPPPFIDVPVATYRGEFTDGASGHTHALRTRNTGGALPVARRLCGQDAGRHRRRGGRRVHAGRRRRRMDDAGDGFADPAVRALSAQGRHKLPAGLGPTPEPGRVAVCTRPDGRLDS